VLAELTHKSATALGIVMALQFGPHALMLPLSGTFSKTANSTIQLSTDPDMRGRGLRLSIHHGRLDVSLAGADRRRPPQ
jgi:hypothetical protein